MQVFTVKLIVSRQVHQGRVLETGGFTFPTRVFYKNVCGVKKNKLPLWLKEDLNLKKMSKNQLFPHLLAALLWQFCNFL
jgi:hypothetical protein